MKIAHTQSNGAKGRTLLYTFSSMAKVLCSDTLDQHDPQTFLAQSLLVSNRPHLSKAVDTVSSTCACGHTTAVFVTSGNAAGLAVTCKECCCFPFASSRFRCAAASFFAAASRSSIATTAAVSALSTSAVCCCTNPCWQQLTSMVFVLKSLIHYESALTVSQGKLSCI